MEVITNSDLGKAFGNKKRCNDIKIVFSDRNGIDYSKTLVINYSLSLTEVI